MGRDKVMEDIHDLATAKMQATFYAKKAAYLRTIGEDTTEAKKAQKEWEQKVRELEERNG